jgi:ribonuclease HI
MKITFDGAFLQDKKPRSWGFVVRDPESSVVPVGAGNLENVHAYVQRPKLAWQQSP